MGNIIKKTVVGVIVGAILFGVTNALGFPFVFQAMFFAYAILGAVVFILLDAPSLRPFSGGKAVGALMVFYLVLCVVYIAGGSLWPQFDPEDEQGKINQILKPKRERFEAGKVDVLMERAKALDEKAKELTARLKALGATDAAADQKAGGDKALPGTIGGAAAGDFMKLGADQWELQECYNCHKLKGEGGKKRGPELDNIGNLMTVEEIKTKILDPKSWMAEGFEKEYEKGKMPDKYKDLMEDSEVQVLSAWLATFKNSAVNTPKAIKKK
ncbi:MAG TPA: cytochrome c [Nitrospiraceae bacterium]|nr:cytochrome c [Nitrospiraceae bacterium]